MTSQPVAIAVAHPRRPRRGHCGGSLNNRGVWGAAPSSGFGFPETLSAAEYFESCREHSKKNVRNIPWASDADTLGRLSRERRYCGTSRPWAVGRAAAGAARRGSMPQPRWRWQRMRLITRSIFVPPFSLMLRIPVETEHDKYKMAACMALGV